MSEQDYKDLCNENTTLEDIEDKRVEEVAKEATSNLSVKNFLLNRAKETIKIPIKVEDGQLDIEIKIRLTNVEMNSQIKFFECIANKEEPVEYMPEFLELITIDEELDKEFWSLPELDAFLGKQLILAFFNKTDTIIGDIKKFR